MLLLQHKGGIFSSENMQSDKKIKRNLFLFEDFFRNEEDLLGHLAAE